MDEEKVLENYILPFLIFLILVNLREKLGMFSYNLNFTFLYTLDNQETKWQICKL
jgi:hypothetical protein